VTAKTDTSRHDGAQPEEGFAVVYDLASPGALKASHRHRAFWGRRFTEIHELDNDRVALVFRPSPDARWRPWEQVRRRWILDDLRGDEKAA
jgi:hypothetical protein